MLCIHACIYLYELYPTESFPPPDNLHFELFSDPAFTFMWNHPIGNCMSYNYRIEATNCGVCPNETNNSISICTNVSTENQMCTFAVHMTACDNYPGTGRDAALSAIIEGIIFIAVQVDPTNVSWSETIPECNYSKNFPTIIFTNYIMLIILL